MKPSESGIKKLCIAQDTFRLHKRMLQKVADEAHEKAILMKIWPPIATKYAGFTAGCNKT